MKYKTKPKTVEAIQWKGRESFSEVVAFLDMEEDDVRIFSDTLIVYANDGKLVVKLGDYIVKQYNNYSVCEKNVFLKNYEELEDDE